MRYENRTFEAEHIILDDNEFIGCTFNDCAMSYSGGYFKIEPFTVDGMSLKFEGPAKNAVELSKHLQALAMASIGQGAFINMGDRWFQEVEKPDFTRGK